MIYKEHYVELIVNKQQVEFTSQSDINIRLNSVINDPTKMGYSQAEYSFEFEIPATPTNNKIFDYANNLAKLNKFHQRYQAELYADGNLIFEGTLTLNSYEGGMYSCNLVSVKIYSLDEIFGGMTMNQIKGMEINFNGVSTMNTMNQESNPICVFPLVSYGAFQKDPYAEDNVGAQYTSKYKIDAYNRWYVESFYPSINLVETLKKSFEGKGYTVGGDVFQDPVLRQIYMSANLADEQVPTYNLGNPSFGNVSVNTSTVINEDGYTQDLQFPFEQLVYSSPDGTGIEEEYNFSQILLYDLLSTGVSANTSPCYMYQPNEHIIVIPADGWYKISLSAHTSASTGSMTAAYYTKDTITSDPELEDVTFTKSLSSTTPIEIALVRNYDDNYELIKGRQNVLYFNGKPEDTDGNKLTWLTCFPHEDPWASRLPTKKNDLQTRMSGTIDPTGGGIVYSNQKYGYMYDAGQIMAYDQAVSPSFICGLSSLSNGVAAYMKNGYSWSKSESLKNESFASCAGYKFAYRPSETPSSIAFEDSSVNYNEYINADMTSPLCTSNNTSMDGHIDCMVHLNKDDVINLFAVTRAYYTVNGVLVTYPVNVSTKLNITAFSDRPQEMLKADHANRKDAPIEFPAKLNLPNFLNKEKEVKEWVDDIIKAFNLEMTQYGNTVQFNTKKLNKSLITAVDLDDRVNSYYIKSQRIDYPRSMAVQYKVDTDEWGFERSAVEKSGGSESILNTDDWYKYADSGFTKIILNDDSYVTEENNINTNFSYTWYQKFEVWETDSAFTQTATTGVDIHIPCISKYSYMIDGYDYSESMKHDGYGLAQRFWFKPDVTELSVWTRTYPAEEMFIYTPKNVLQGLNLSYKDTETSLLSRYFNPQAYLSSNIIEFEAYLSSEEYNLIRNGAYVHVDKDVYIPLEISGYDPSGQNQTELKLIKRIQ